MATRASRALTDTKARMCIMMDDEGPPNDGGHLGNVEELVMLPLDHPEGYGCDHTDTKIVERLGNR